MKHDQLYLIKHGFQDQGKTYYCPGCSEMIGVLEFYPALKQHVEIHYVDFARPRPELVSLLGEANQGCPVLVLATRAAKSARASQGVAREWPCLRGRPARDRRISRPRPQHRSTALSHYSTSINTLKIQPSQK